MALNRPIDFTSDQRKALISQFSGHLPNRESRMYGSQVRGTSRQDFDLDMAVFAAPYQDEPRFCISATLDVIRAHNHLLTPSRYVGAAVTEDDDVPFERRFAELRGTLEVQFAKADELSPKIRERLGGVGAQG
ncbi:MAG: N-6 DNA methylase [Boseongicola sp. SB0664_bin_43]|uniref:N-6 DNA methylase n=1 Tax=Boseongicola sp. SB0664_bin_43 TaxID=2604844 RepID=A0A6B0Y260_9RHOB|nr:N-6 DNA methylase [Boseongicola sp. SB0664_bin_43]MYK32903.1 N-6 DNA methylase [Boseongicola sp. SB0670_bin_30]